MITLPGYAPLELVHRGRLHDLFRARRIADGRSFAIKMPASPPSPRALATLRHEYDLLHDVYAAGIVRVLALERVGSALALVMEDAGRQSLAEHMAGKPLGI